MNTTNLLVELVVIGIFSLLWFIPSLELLLKNDSCSLIGECSSICLLLLIGFIYFLGIVVNLFSDWFVYFLNCYIYKKNGSKNLIKQKRNYILLKSSDGAIHLSQRISILRLFRANSFNILLFFLTTFINPDSFLIKSIKDIKTFQIILILLFIFLILGYVKNFCGYCSFINTSYKIIKGEKK